MDDQDIEELELEAASGEAGAAADEAVLEDEPPTAEELGLETVEGAPTEDEEPPPEGQQTILRSDAPGVPWAIDLRSSVTHYTPTPDGGMIIQFTAAVPTPQGAMVLPPGVLVRFKKAGWEAFQKEVAAGGVKAPAIQTSSVVPASPADIRRARRRGR